MLDYIIVGSGLAGIAFAETLSANGRSFAVYDNHSQNSSQIAGGLYNPVILKRFSQVQDASRQLSLAERFYGAIEAKLNRQFDFKLPIYRKFFSIEEQNNWFAASDKPNLAPFLSTQLVHRKFNAIESPFGFGEVLHTGYVDTAALLHFYQSFLRQSGLLREEDFQHDLLKVQESHVSYRDIQARRIVFAEGFGLHANPFFNYLPLDGTKGELLLIKAPGLDLDVIINTSVFILPIGGDLFKVGATYNWDDKTPTPTTTGKKELVDRIREILNCDFEIVEHLAGVRPTVKDRKALLGTHHLHQNVHILNGLGTRGVMLAPAMALDLFNHIEYGAPLDKTIDIKRCTIS